MASLKSPSPVMTVYQCSACDHCSPTLEEATLHAVQEHGNEERDDDVQGDFDDETYPKVGKKVDKDAGIHISDDEFSSAVYKQPNGNLDTVEGQSSTDISNGWSVTATKHLIDLVQENYDELKSKGSKKAIWDKIKAALETQPGAVPGKCEQKWKNILASQKKYLEACNRPYGKRKLKKPQFFNEVLKAIGEDTTECKYDVEPESSSPVATTSTSKSKDNIVSILNSLLEDNNVDTQKDAISVLNQVVSLLERRESANQKFQREVLEMEREKLKCIQRFVDGREKFNAKRLQIMREFIMNQPTAKRRKEWE